MQHITPFLWFNGQADEAVQFYTALFPNSRIVSVTRYGSEMPQMAGKILTAVFELNGQEFMALDGDVDFHFTEATSFFVHCETQAEVDDLWSKLTADGGEESQCGWLKDKFGLSWQIIPNTLGEMLQDHDRERASRVMQAMLKMRKIEIAALQQAYDGR